MGDTVSPRSDIMKRLRISHLTEYSYSSPVTFAPHRIVVRPREGHDVHIQSSKLAISPNATVRWLRDIYGNSIAIASFNRQSNQLRILSEVVVAHYEHDPLNFVIDPTAAMYPFRYRFDEQVQLIPYQISSYPKDGSKVAAWLEKIYQPGGTIGTLDLLAELNATIFREFAYVRREEPGVQAPAQTLQSHSGSCRDFATLMMECARFWGFGARFVSGYLETAPGQAQHGATHAWTEIYIPGAGWRGFDPTNGKFAAAEHVSVAVDRDPERAAPVGGSWTGPTGTRSTMHVNVEVSQIP